MKKKLLTKFGSLLCCTLLSSNMYSIPIVDNFRSLLHESSNTTTSTKELNSTEIDGFLYSLDFNSRKATLQGVISSIKGELSEAVIPTTVSILHPNYKEEYQVTAIDNGAFIGCEKLASVTIPEGVIHIGSNAFKDCKALADIIIPQSITTIGREAFSGTEWYEKNFSNDGLIYINSIAYTYNGEMPKDTTLSIKEGTVSITELAFFYCKNLISISLPTSLKIIGSKAFLDCEKLSEITFPENLEYIGEEVFTGTSINKLTIPASVNYLGRGNSTNEMRFEGVTPPNNNNDRPPYSPEATYYVPLKSFAAYYKANLIPLGTKDSQDVRTLEDNTIIYGVTTSEEASIYGNVTLNGEKESIIGIKAGENIRIEIRAVEGYTIADFQINDEEPFKMDSPYFSYVIYRASEYYEIKVRFKYIASISDEKVDAIRVYTSNATVKIENAFETTLVTILNLAGQSIYQGTTDSYEAVSLPNGMYIVKVGTETHKIVMK